MVSFWEKKSSCKWYFQELVRSTIDKLFGSSKNHNLLYYHAKAITSQTKKKAFPSISPAQKSISKEKRRRKRPLERKIREPPKISWVTSNRCWFMGFGISRYSWSVKVKILVWSWETLQDSILIIAWNLIYWLFWSYKTSVDKSTFREKG